MRKMGDFCSANRYSWKCFYPRHNFLAKFSVGKAHFCERSRYAIGPKKINKTDPEHMPGRDHIIRSVRSDVASLRVHVIRPPAPTNGCIRCTRVRRVCAPCSSYRCYAHTHTPARRVHNCRASFPFCRVFVFQLSYQLASPAAGSLVGPFACGTMLYAIRVRRQVRSYWLLRSISCGLKNYYYSHMAPSVYCGCSAFETLTPRRYRMRPMWNERKRILNGILLP